MNSYLLTLLPPTPPPTAELFTREWLNPILLDPFPFETKVVEVFQTYKDRAIDTKRKLKILHHRLEKYNSTLFGNSVPGIQHTVTWMWEKVGLFHIVPEKDKGGWMVKNVLMQKEASNSLYCYYEVSHKLHWEGYVWGWEQREDGLVFVMLDRTAVTWLNELHKWCDEVAKDNEKETI